MRLWFHYSTRAHEEVVLSSLSARVKCPEGEGLCESVYTTHTHMYICTAAQGLRESELQFGACIYAIISKEGY